MRFPVFIQAIFIAAFPTLGWAQEAALPLLKLCPATVHQTCFIGYVTETNKLSVFVTSIDMDATIGQTVDVAGVDLSTDVGRVVMLDGTGGDTGITASKIVAVADPLLTALYVTTFSAPPDAGME